MKKILLATEKPFAAEAVESIKKIVIDSGFEFLLIENYKSVSELLDVAKNANAMIIRSDIVSKEVVNACPNLEIVVRAGAGYDNVDLNAASAKKVVVMNTPGQNSNAVAELALGMMVFMARGLFNGKSGTELKGKKLGILAYGNVGKNIARIAKGFGMEVYAFDAFVPKANIEKDNVKVVGSTQELFETCQYVSLNIPATEQTKKSINKALISKMPKGAVIVNTARKEIINEAELLEMMEIRKDLKYISDIEPDCKDIFAEKYAGRFYFTPKKMGAQTEEANVNAGIAAANQIVNFFKNGDTKFKVN